MITKDIEELAKEKHLLETDIAQKEADIKIKNGEIKSLQVRILVPLFITYKKSCDLFFFSSLTSTLLGTYKPTFSSEGNYSKLHLGTIDKIVGLPQNCDQQSGGASVEERSADQRT